MLLLNLNLYASLRKISGTKTVAFTFQHDATVQQILEAVLTLYPEMHKKLIDQDGQLDRHAHIFVNGRNCLLLEKGLETSILASDTLDIFPIGHF